MEAETTHDDLHQGSAGESVFQYQQTVVTLPAGDALSSSDAGQHADGDGADVVAPMLIRRNVGVRESDDDEPMTCAPVDRDRSGIENLTDHL
jgi:hypothetical protein